MGNVRLPVTLILASVASFALAEPRNPARLTWAPYQYLEKGFRTAPWVKDPFYPDENGLKLSAVISHELAYVNGRWLRKGDQVDGYTVREIGPAGVTLMRRSEIMVLKMEN